LGPPDRDRSGGAVLLWTTGPALLGRGGPALGAAALHVALSRAARDRAGVRLRATTLEAAALGVVDGPRRWVPRARRLEPGDVLPLPAAAGGGPALPDQGLDPARGRRLAARRHGIRARVHERPAPRAGGRARGA